MKKFLYLACAVALSACSNTVTEQMGAEDIRKLDKESTGCEFLYKLETESAVYSYEDAERYLKNRIAGQENNKGNAFLIVYQRTRENPDAVFGPKKSFILTANVYECL